MMPSRRTLLIVTVGFLSGCGPYGLLGDLGIYPSFDEQARRRAAAQAAEQEAARQRREAGTIRAGDTPEYVRMQWGEPIDVRTSIIGDSTSEWWEYVTGAYSSSYVHFINGKVYAIHQ